MYSHILHFSFLSSLQKRGFGAYLRKYLAVTIATLNDNKKHSIQDMMVKENRVFETRKKKKKRCLPF